MSSLLWCRFSFSDRVFRIPGFFYGLLFGFGRRRPVRPWLWTLLAKLDCNVVRPMADLYIGPVSVCKSGPIGFAPSRSIRGERLADDAKIGRVLFSGASHWRSANNATNGAVWLADGALRQPPPPSRRRVAAAAAANGAASDVTRRRGIAHLRRVVVATCVVHVSRRRSDAEATPISDPSGVSLSLSRL